MRGWSETRSAGPGPAPPGERGEGVGIARAIGDAAAISRFHILLIGAVAAVTFGWLLTGRYLWIAGGLAALDWFFINLANKVTDIEEDLRNGIQGTERVVRWRRVLTGGVLAAWAASLLVGHLLAAGLTAPRLAVAAIGLSYSFRLIPTPTGRRRMKELYFLKNFGSAVLFVLTGFAYPLALAAAADRAMSWGEIAVLIGFFVPFELTFEILYDLRDLEGDRAVGIPTYPAVHGPAVARRIVDALLALCALVLAGGFLAGWIGLRELLMIAAPALQLAFYRPRLVRGLTSRDCVLLTHLGTVQLLVYLIGTAVWLRAGLPANLRL